MILMSDEQKHAEFLKLFMSNRHEIMAFIKATVRNSTQSEDIFQEVSIILWEKFDSYDQNRSFKAWARGIASNKILQFWDKQKKSAVVLSPEVMNSVLAAYERTENKSNDSMMLALNTCIAQLPENQSIIINSKYVDRLRLDAIAERIGKSLAATQKSLSRIRFALQDCVKKQMAKEY